MNKTLSDDEKSAAAKKLWHLLNSTTISPLPFSVVEQWAVETIEAALALRSPVHADGGVSTSIDRHAYRVAHVACPAFIESGKGETK